MNSEKQGVSNPKPRFDRSDLISVIALLSSLAALFLTAYEANIMKKQQEIMQEQQKASVWPYVTTEVVYESSDDGNQLNMSFSVKNKGIGPAMVKYADILVNDKVLNKESTDQLSAELTKQLSEGVRVVAIVKDVDDQLIAPGESRPWIDLIVSNIEFPFAVASSVRLDANICYCSIYKDCWTNSAEKEPSPSSCGS